MTHHQFAATAAKWAFRLSPFTLLAIAVLAFSQDRYSTWNGMSSPVWHGCARPEMVAGNARIKSIEAQREKHLANAAYNMGIIDNYDPSPRYTGPRLWLRGVFGWLEAKELIDSVFLTVKDYDRTTINNNINSHYDWLKVRTDMQLRNATEHCANLTNRVRRANDQANGMSAKYVISYGITYLGLNGWMAWPVRTIVTVIEVTPDQQEQDAG